MNDAQTRLGDFRASALYLSGGAKNTSTVDYTYDANGNLVKDLNKDIVTYGGANGIEYNYLNLPQKITVKKDGSNNKGTIEYTYDAAGNKLRKTVYEPGVDTTVTLYIAGNVYRNDTLEFISYEEGRIRKKGTTALVYDYMLKDHLGNVRMMLTTERDTSFYPVASLETASLATERTYYGGVDTGRVNKSTVAGYPSDTYTNPNDFIQKLNGGGPKIGTNMVLKVMAGDKVNLFAKSWYKKNGVTPGTPVNPLTNILNVLEPAIGGITGTHGGATLTELQTTSVLDNQVTSFLNSQSGYTTSKPKAFVNWVLFDDQFKYVAASSGFEQVGADNTLTTHTPAAINILKGGYLYIYVSNETPNIDVFFDNLQVTHIRGPILEETQYYPFGLTMAGISSRALAFGGNINRYKFNDGTELSKAEFSDGVGLDWYETSFRGYDAQIGRFWQIDPLAEATDNITPYAYCNNNPISFNDPLGLDTTVTINGNQQLTLTDSEQRSAVTVSATRKKSATPDTNTAASSTPGADASGSNSSVPTSEAKGAPEGFPINPPKFPVQTKPLGPQTGRIPIPGPKPGGQGIGFFASRTAGALLAAAIPTYGGLAKGQYKHPYEAFVPEAPAWLGHGNDRRNTNPHIVYYFTYNAKPGESTILKYGISDYLRYGNDRPERQLSEFRAKYGPEVTYSIYVRTSNRETALFIERLMVTQHEKRWGRKPIEQDRPGSFPFGYFN